LKCTTLQVVKPMLIVQSWRSVNFAEDDSDSTLIISFSPEDDDGRIDLIHLDVPRVIFKAFPVVGSRATSNPGLPICKVVKHEDCCLEPLKVTKFRLITCIS